MKFGEHLRSQKYEPWSYAYLDYDKLKNMIRELEDQQLLNYQQDMGAKGTSLSIPRPTNAAGVQYQTNIAVTQEQFYAFLEHEMRKIEQFTKKQVEEVRQVLSEVEAITNTVSFLDSSDTSKTALQERIEKTGEKFLQLEMYVNLNFTGIHKILKKHDRRLPNPCKVFYSSRLHNQSWVRGDYSDVIVTMSKIYSVLRGEEKVEEVENAKQNFVRSTRKYWVHTEDISSIKYTVLRHLPVFLQKAMGGETDSQLVNSVYLDNYSMELYHGRLDKSPGAIALRLRWYGSNTPDVVFVERKTHRESWAGEISVKERFIIKETQVLSLLSGTFDLQGEIAKLRDKGKSEEDVEEYAILATEIIQAINSKQLVPTLRTQYMRTAFQIPFDATVRVSLDTNLCMISERTKDTINRQSWYRDPNTAVPNDEITRFPHAVLEVKLQLQDEDSTPEWVQDMLESGKLLEVHKFSKFIHGGAVLMPEDVRAVPYWIDDSTLASSIVQSGASKLLAKSKGANEFYQQLLPHDKDGKSKLPKRPSEGMMKSNSADREEQGQQAPIVPPLMAQLQPVPRTGGSHSAHRSTSTSPYCRWSVCGDGEEECCAWAGHWESSHITIQKVEPKLFFANERTFIKWLHMAVYISSISIGVLAFSGRSSQSQDFAMMLLPVSLLFIGYALSTFLWRSEMIKTRNASRWDDPYGPIILTVMLILVLTTQFVMKIYDVFL